MLQKRKNSLCPPSKEHFYIGYKPMSRGLAIFLSYIVTIVIGIFLGLGMVFGISQSDPGNGEVVPRNRDDPPVTGMLVADPYPIVYVLPNEAYPQGRSLLLVGQGKRGVREKAIPYNRQIVEVTGSFIRRDGMTLVQVSKIRPSETDLTDLPPEQRMYTPPKPDHIDKVRLQGEIVDGKCCVGAMRPGVGKMHMSCANLCLIGGVPPLFITMSSQGQFTYFLLTDHKGQAISEPIYEYVSRMVSVEGNVERWGNILVFQIDLETLSLL